MSNEVVLKIKNFTAQNIIFASDNRYKIVAKGRRFGLTRGMANEYMKMSFEEMAKVCGRELS